MSLAVLPLQLIPLSDFHFVFRNVGEKDFFEEIWAK